MTIGIGIGLSPSITSSKGVREYITINGVLYRLQSERGEPVLERGVYQYERA